MIKASRKAYTLVEIMIVVAIIAAILAIAIPNYLKSSRISSANVCINNLKQIDGAVEQWALDNGIQQGVMPTSQDEDVIYGYIDGGKPKCPSSGEYSINRIGDKPQASCSKEDLGHKLPE